MNSDNNTLDSFCEREAFTSWQARAREAEKEEMLLKRKAELNYLVRKVIKQELDELDRKLVELHWYKGLSKAEIARTLNLDRSTVHRHFVAINETVYEKLKYAVELIYGNGCDEFTKENAKENAKENSKAFSSHINSDDISKRFRMP